MPLYNFKPQFVPFVQDGSKTHTIRSIRRYPPKVGDMLYLYTGLRQPGAKRLIDPVPCTAIQTIFILPGERVFVISEVYNKLDAAAFLKDHNSRRRKFLSGYKTLTRNDKNLLAWNDGFRDFFGSDFHVMFQYWKTTNALPFAGHITVWHPDPQSLPYLRFASPQKNSIATTRI